MLENYIITPYIQLRNSSIIYYNQVEYLNSSNKFSNNNTIQKGSRNNAYSGEMKTGTQKRIRKALDLFLQSTTTQYIYNPATQKSFNFRLAFITLTISSKEIQDPRFVYKNLLRPFLDWLKKTKKVDSYIWKAELQKRGQIHYHITTSNYIHHTEIREKWNYLQRKNKLINNSYNPPSTEIKSVKNITNIEHYLAKYIAKASEQEKKLNCKCWDCSENLKKNKYFTLELTEKVSNELIKNYDKIEVVKEVQLDNCLIVKSKEKYIEKLLCNDLINEYKKYLECIKNNELFISIEKKTQIEMIAQIKKKEDDRLAKIFTSIHTNATKKHTAPLRLNF